MVNLGHYIHVIKFLKGSAVNRLSFVTNNPIDERVLNKIWNF